MKNRVGFVCVRTESLVLLCDMGYTSVHETQLWSLSKTSHFIHNTGDDRVKMRSALFDLRVFEVRVQLQRDLGRCVVVG